MTNLTSDRVFVKPFSKRPPSKTGLDSQTVSWLDTNFSLGIHWVQGTGKATKEELMYIFPDYLAKFHPNDEFVFEWGVPTRVGVDWEHSGRSVEGIKAGFTELPDGQYKYWVGIPGTWLEALTLPQIIKLLHDLVGLWQFKPTRLDPYLDDHLSRITPQQVYDTYAIDGNHTGFQKATITKSKTGDTVYCGSRQSDNMTRIYHTKEKHGHDAVRFEREMKGDQAAQFAEELIAFTQDGNFGDAAIAQFLANTVVGHIGFRDRSGGDKNVSRLPLLQWWADFLEALQACPLKLPPPIVKPTFEKTVNWMKRCTAKSLAKIHNAVPNFVQELLDLGNEKQDNFSRAQSRVIAYSN